MLDVLLILRLLQLQISCSDVLLLKVVEVLSGVEVDVITELWPVDVLQEVDVMLFSTRYTSDRSASVSTCSCGRVLAVLQR